MRFFNMEISTHTSVTWKENKGKIGDFLKIDSYHFRRKQEGCQRENMKVG